MPTHWQFLELSVPVRDIQASLDFYLGLGFTELHTGDIRRYAYTAVTDGRIAIGLHADELPAPALSFVQADAARWARQLEAAGFRLEFQRLGTDDFHEFALTAPGDQLAVVMEAPTFSRQSIQAANAPLTGPSSYIELSSPDIEAAISFWAIAGLAPTDDDSERESGSAMLAAPALWLRLSGERRSSPLLHFAFPESQALRDAAYRLGVDVTAGGGICRLSAPEGTLIELAMS